MNTWHVFIGGVGKVGQKIWIQISQGIEESMDEQVSRFAMIDSERNVKRESNITLFFLVRDRYKI